MLDDYPDFVSFSGVASNFLPTIWERFMKLINTESPVFTNASINFVLQILGDDRRASRLRLRTLSSLMTPSSYTWTSWRWISAGRMFVGFKTKSSNAPHNRRDQGLTWFFNKTLTQQPIHLGKQWRRGRGSDDSSRPSKTCAGKVHKQFLLQT
jgi:hypothetical protein